MSKDLLKLMIIDDEYLIRELLKRCIDWADAGYEIVSEASCAQEALELVEIVNPDVIITDIRMPFMDGIELAKIIFEKYPHIKIVVLTGYEEFEYAKRSIKIGIADFLLKPINEEEILKVVLNIKNKIEKEKSHRDEYTRLKKQLEENLPYLKDKFLNDLISSEFDDLAQKAAYFNININNHIFFHIAVIDVSYPEAKIKDIGEEIGEEEKLLLKIQSLELVRQYFRQDENVYVFMDNSQRLVILNSEAEIDLMECLDAIKTMLNNKLKCFVSIGVGFSVTSPKKIPRSYKEACEALNYRVVEGKNQIIHVSDINFLSSEKVEIEYSRIERLSFMLKAGMESKAVEFLDNILGEVSLSQNVGISSIRAVASNIISVVLGVVSELEIPSNEIFTNDIQPFEEVFKLDTYPEIKEYLINLLKRTISIIKNIKNKKVNQVIQQIKEHIIKNLSNSELSLSGTAKEFYLNRSYLSRIFKQEAGQTFVEYISKLRMEKAIKLLQTTDLKAYQIAEEVGITDSHYFSICFKKYTGMSINDFKKENN